MATYNLQVKARRNESAEALIKRFSRKIKNSGIIREVRQNQKKKSLKQIKTGAK